MEEIMKDVAVKIIKVGDERKTTKGTPFRYLTVKQLDLGTEHEVCVFYNKREWALNMGDEITITIDTYEHNGETKFRSGLDKITPLKDVQGELSPPQSPAPTKGQPQPDWDAKDRRMARMNSLSHAVKTVELEMYQYKNSDSELLLLQDIITRVLTTANEYEQWIYRN